jgi:hypothetical protein
MVNLSIKRVVTGAYYKNDTHLKGALFEVLNKK